MVDVDNLSDAELRSKLIECGFPVMPITGTTRKTMAKKLKMLLENKKKLTTNNKDSHSRKSLGRYSSEEESDTDSKTSLTRKKQRQTLAGPVLMQPPLTTKIAAAAPASKRLAKPDEDPHNSSAAEKVKSVTSTTTTTTRTTKMLSMAKDEFDTGSESDEVAEKYESPAKSPQLNKSLPLPSSFISAASVAENASDRINQIRSRLSQYSPAVSSQSYSYERVTDAENTPFLSNFTRRLSQLSESSPKPFKNDVIKESDANGSNSRSYINNYRSPIRGRASSGGFSEYKTSASHVQSNLLKNNIVPLTVLIVAFLFFIVVAGVYLGIRSDAAREVAAVIPRCVRNDASLKPYVNCVLETESKSALTLFKVLKPQLEERAVGSRCGARKSKSYMTEYEIVSFILSRKMVQNRTKVQEDLSNLEVLAFFNPAWALNVLKVNEEEGTQTTARNMEELSGSVIALEVVEFYVPWKCYLYNTLSTCLYFLATLFAGLLVSYTLLYSFKSYKAFKQRQHEEELILVENIIEILQTHASESSSSSNSPPEDCFLVINHVRDMILPPSERKAKEKLWKRAVKYIEENESRIRIEVQVVRGEHAEVWRWLGSSSLNASLSLKNKSWQGQAFETQVGSVNSLPCSPTPCLKIRGMVEEGERNTAAIRRAVLGKCAQECRILHCGIETSSKCVYLKCADTGDAAVAYRNLHGWWYAGNLVTVKYLRLERYMQRFPESPASGPPFLQ